MNLNFPISSDGPSIEYTRIYHPFFHSDDQCIFIQIASIFHSHVLLLFLNDAIIFDPFIISFYSPFNCYYCLRSTSILTRFYFSKVLNHISFSTFRISFIYFLFCIQYASNFFDHLFLFYLLLFLFFRVFFTRISRIDRFSSLIICISFLLLGLDYNIFLIFLPLFSPYIISLYYLLSLFFFLICIIFSKGFFIPTIFILAFFRIDQIFFLLYFCFFFVCTLGFCFYSDAFNVFNAYYNCFIHYLKNSMKIFGENQKNKIFLFWELAIQLFDRLQHRALHFFLQFLFSQSFLFSSSDLQTSRGISTLAFRFHV